MVKVKSDGFFDSFAPQRRVVRDDEAAASVCAQWLRFGALKGADRTLQCPIVVRGWMLVQQALITIR